MIKSAYALAMLGTRMLGNVEQDHFLYDRLARIFQVSSAAVSFTASLLLVVLISQQENGGLSSPYRRIIFGLSLSDIIQSFALLTGPISVPSWIEASWGRGNHASCQANGFLLTISLDAVPMYTCFLCLYYVCKLKFKMTDRTFFHNIERYMHTVIVILNLLLASAALGLDVFHTNAYHRSFCYFASVPLYCRFEPEKVGECDVRIQKRVEFFTALVSVGLPTACIIGIIVFMIILVWYAVSWRTIIRMELPNVNLRRSNRNNGGSNSNASSPNESEGYEEGRDHQQDVEALSKLFVKETVINASCYILAFCLTYLPMIASYWNLISGDVRLDPCPIALQLTLVFFFPLGGLFNILVYTRPEVASLRRSHPTFSRIKALWLVIKAGGRAPRDANQSNTDANSSPRPEVEEVIEDEVFSLPSDFESIRTPSPKVSSSGVIQSSKPYSDSRERSSEPETKNRPRVHHKLPSSFEIK